MRDIPEMKTEAAPLQWRPFVIYESWTGRLAWTGDGDGARIVSGKPY